MNKTARRITASAALGTVLVAGGGMATNTAQAAPQPQTVTTQEQENRNPAVTFTGAASINLDPVAIGNAIADAVNDKNDRGAVVRAALDSGYYNSGGKNVVVINQEVEFDKSFPADKTAVGTFEKNGKTYSVFIFEGGGFIENKGDGGWINWGMQGNFTRDGNRATFY